MDGWVKEDRMVWVEGVEWCGGKVGARERAREKDGGGEGS